MTPTEIRNLIAKKIEGQGSAIDIGNGLPAIPNGILDEIAAIPAPKPIFELTGTPEFESKTAAEVVALNIGFNSEAEVEDFFENLYSGGYEYIIIHFSDTYQVRLTYGGGYLESHAKGGAYINCQRDDPSTISTAIYGIKADGLYTIDFHEL